MENASKALIIAGAILLSILLIAIGMYIYNSSAGTIQDAGSAISTYEKDSFNAQYESFEGQQQGSNVKSMISKMISNGKTYEEESTKLPSLAYKARSDGSSSYATGGVSAVGATPFSRYISDLTTARTNIETRHTYTVVIKYSPTTALIDRIEVIY